MFVSEREDRGTRHNRHTGELQAAAAARFGVRQKFDVGELKRIDDLERPNVGDGPFVRTVM